MLLRMRFQVPQFIEVEDKIFGPLSFRQFVYLAGALGFGVVVYNYLGWIFAVLLGIPFFGLGFLLAFYKVNNRPFIELVQAAMFYAMNKKLYLWKQKPKKQERHVPTKKERNTIVKPFVPKTAENKLKDLAWSLDIKESMYSDESQVKQ